MPNSHILHANAVAGYSSLRAEGASDDLNMLFEHVPYSFVHSKKFVSNWVPPLGPLTPFTMAMALTSK